MASGGADRASSTWRRALSGLTPQVVAIVMLLLFARMISVTSLSLVVQVRDHQFGAWVSNTFTGFAMLLLMALPMLLGVTATSNFGPQQGTKRFATLIVAVFVFSGTGLLLRVSVQDLLGTGLGWSTFVPWMSYLWPRYALLCGMLTIAAEFYRWEVASIEAMQEAELVREALEREMAEARLQALQAQIEPHFLFNTLANVARLYEKDRAAGHAMLDNLMRYLEVALPRMRDKASTLGQDSDVVAAFLQIQQIRMGSRLAFSVEIPASLRAHPVPPMMLLTLVENAIKHGLNPSLRGGLVRVGASSDGQELKLSVADTGVGFAPGSGGGTGLANIRARLAAQFGDRADLRLENNDLGGVTATLALPIATPALAS